jgi:hypothetical protein
MAKRIAANVGAMRFVARFVRRPTGYDSRGQQEQEDVIIYEDIPCSVTPLSGRELEAARQRVATADLRVECCGPLVITSKDVAVLNDQRRLTIGYVEDVYQDGRLLRLVCTAEA